MEMEDDFDLCEPYVGLELSKDVKLTQIGDVAMLLYTRVW
jgi:hypothetical protein